MANGRGFDELMFFAQVKEKPGLYMGKKSLLSLRDYIFGMHHAFAFYSAEKQFVYFTEFVQWYMDEVIRDKNGYAAWWNHMLYTSGNHDDRAFDHFFSGV